MAMPKSHVEGEMFEVTGRLAGRGRTLRWPYSELDGDPLAVEEVRL
jgi:hypothetical protein